jgi:hypothetical protein
VRLELDICLEDWILRVWGLGFGVYGEWCRVWV